MLITVNHIHFDLPCANQEPFKDAVPAGAQIPYLPLHQRKHRRPGKDRVLRNLIKSREERPHRQRLQNDGIGKHQSRWRKGANQVFHLAHIDGRLASDRAGQVKVDVVNRDEHEADLRRLLNLGHTFGHALEEATGYRRLLHGEGVGWGLLCAARLGVLLDMLDVKESERIAGLIRRIGPLPSIRDLAPAKIMRLVPRDKKAVAGQIHWVVPEKIGRVRIVRDVPIGVAAEALRSVQRTEAHG